MCTLRPCRRSAHTLGVMTTNSDALSEGRIRIEASCARVLDVVLDLPAYPQWSKDVARAVVLSRTPSGDVDQAQLTFASGPFKDVVTLAYTVARRADRARVAWQLVEAQHIEAMQGHYDLRADGDATDVAYALHARPGFPLHTALRRKVETQIITAALDALKAHAEAPDLDHGGANATA